MGITTYENKKMMFRNPSAKDGSAMYQLVKEAKVLDENSPYSYLMWGKYFHETSIVAERDGQLVGFITGFLQPQAQDTLFVWQVTVDESMRGKGLATHLLIELVNRLKAKHVRYIEATVTPSNTPSINLFTRLADKLKTDCHIEKCFSREQFPGGHHEPEFTYRIGPIN